MKSQVRLFANDCLLYRQIKNREDHILLQNDLTCLEEWAHKWGMRYNAKKCYVMSIKGKSSCLFNIDKIVLQQVTENPYLWILLSEDLGWSRHIASKASTTLGFVRRNLKNCPISWRKDRIHCTRSISASICISRMGPLSYTRHWQARKNRSKWRPFHNRGL